MFARSTRSLSCGLRGLAEVLQVTQVEQEVAGGRHHDGIDVGGQLFCYRELNNLGALPQGFAMQTDGLGLALGPQNSSVALAFGLHYYPLGSNFSLLVAGDFDQYLLLGGLLLFDHLGDRLRNVNSA